MSRLTLSVSTETLRLAQPFRIAGYVFETADVMVVGLSDGEHRGRGEGAGVYYVGDDLAHMRGAVEGAREAIEAGPSREELRALKRDPAMIAQLFSDPEEPEERFNPDEFGRE